MNRVKKSTNWFSAALWILIGLGVVVRSMKLPLMEFKGDEFHFLTQSITHPFSPSLHSSISIPHPPTFGYLLSSITLFLQDPLQVTACIVVLNLVGLWILFGLCKRIYSLDVAVITTAILASMPWAVLFSRKIWNPDIIFPLQMLLLACLESLIRSYRPWKLVLFSIILAVCMQVHLLTVLLIIPVCFVMFTAQVPIKKSEGVVALFLFVLLFVPYLLHISPESSAAASGIGDQLISAQRFWWVKTSTGLGFDYVLGAKGYEEFLSLYNLKTAPIIFTLYVIAAYGAFLWVILRLHRQWLPSFILVWSIVLAAFLSAIGSTSVPHYWTALLMVLPLSVGIVSDRLLQILPPLWKNILQVSIVVVVGTQVVFMLSFYHFLENESEKITGDYGMPYSFSQEHWMQEIEKALTDD